jgi:hypothetical protein
MGGAQPLAGVMAKAAILCIEIDPARIAKRIETGYLEGGPKVCWSPPPSNRTDATRRWVKNQLSSQNGLSSSENDTFGLSTS